MRESSSSNRLAHTTGRTQRGEEIQACHVICAAKRANKSLSLRGNHCEPKICYEASWESPCGSSKYIRSFQRLEKLPQSRTSARPNRCTVKRRNRNSKEEEGSKREQ